MDIVWGEYQEDSPKGPQGVPTWKKGDRYFKAIPGYSEFVSYYAHFFSEAGILEIPRNATEEQIKDLKGTKNVILCWWDCFEEESLIKVIARAKSKKQSISWAVRELLAQTEGFKKWAIETEKMLNESKNTNTKTPRSGSNG